MTTLEKICLVKAQVPEGMIVFFKVGDFYECYSNDALIVKDKLSLPLHERDGLHCVAVPCHAIYRIQDELWYKHRIRSFDVRNPSNLEQ